MGAITGDKTVEIAAPVERCYAIAADLERATSWYPVLQEVEVHRRDDAGRPLSATLVTDAKVRTLTGRWQIEYAEFTAISWVQDKGDVKSLEGSWRFEELAGGLTRATYAMAVDPGRMLGLLLRGPGVVDSVRRHPMDNAAEGLKQQAESS